MPSVWASFQGSSLLQLPFPHSLLAGPDGPAALAARGLAFPLLLRAPGFHMGEHFVMVESAAELAAAVDEMPGAGMPDAKFWQSSTWMRAGRTAAPASTAR